MRYSTVAASLALAAGASAHFNGTVSYTTEVVDVYTTYCPYATHLTYAGATYTVTEATTLTITNCPCTITKPVAPTTVPVVVPSVSVPTVTASVPVVAPSVAPSVSVSTPAIPPPIVSSPVVVPPPVTSSVVIPPPVATSVVPPPVFANSTVPAPAPTGTGSPSTPVSPSISAFTGAGSRVAASGASLAAIMGLAALFL